MANRAGRIEVAVALTAIAGLSGCSDSVRVYIDGAHVVPVSEIARSGAGNRVELDSATVVILKDWDRGGVFVRDDERFQEVLIELPAIDVGRRIDVQAEGIKTYLTAGSLVWAGGQCMSSRALGSVTVEEYSNADIKIDVDLEFNCEYPKSGGRPMAPRNVTIRGAFGCDKATLDGGVWVGGPSHRRPLSQ